MKQAELARRLSALAGPSRKAHALFLSSLAGIIDSGVDHARAAYNTFELSVGSNAGLSRVQITHLHSLSSALKPRLAATKARAVRQAIKKLGGLSAGWPVAMAHRLIGDFIRFKGARTLLPFSCEYDMLRGRPEKTSIYACPQTPAQLRLIASRLGLGRSPVIGQQDLDCIGVDFWPNGKAGLKIYEKHLFSLGKIPDPRIRRLCAAAAKRHAVRDLLLLRRITPAGDLAPPSKIVLRFQEGIPADKICAAPYKPVLTGLLVYYVGFSEKHELELSLRQGPAPWSPRR